MLVITPEKINAYTRCPKQAYFSWHEKIEVPVDQQIISDLVKATYIYYTRKNIMPKWRHILNWTQRKLATELVFSDDKETYKGSKFYLGRMSQWYEEFFLNQYCYQGLINIPIYLGLGQHIQYKDSIDLVLLNKQHTMVDFVFSQEPTHYNKKKLYNDYVLRSKVWGFQKAAETQVSEYVRIVISTQVVRFVSIAITQDFVDCSERIIKQVARGMKDNIYYPSFSEQCYNCPFRSKCYI